MRKYISTLFNISATKRSKYKLLRHKMFTLHKKLDRAREELVLRNTLINNLELDLEHMVKQFYRLQNTKMVDNQLRL